MVIVTAIARRDVAEDVCMDKALNLSFPDHVETTSSFTRDEQLAQIEIATLAIIFGVTVLGNSCVLAAISFRRAKISRISFVLVLTAVDRYEAICRPLTYCTWPARRAWFLVAGAWTLALLCCAPQLFVFSYRPVQQQPDVFDCWATFEPGYATSVFLVPLMVLVVAYFRICQALWRNYNLKQRAQQNGLLQPNFHFYPRIPMEPRTHSLRGISRAKLRSIKLTIVVIACYVICSTPFIGAQLWATWDPEAMQSPFCNIDYTTISPTFTIVTLLASLNSCVNPWIYLAFNPELARLLITRGRVVSGLVTGAARPRRLGGNYSGANGSDSSESRSGGSTCLHEHLPLNHKSSVVIKDQNVDNLQ
ncbi:hypothetical protein B566_EDAN004712 [Ephemera danica]|nr:hypothetical protein B566_EDAN004712 [Ephemera danica]